MRRTLRDAVKLLQQPAAVGGVVAVFAGVAGGIDPRCAAEGIHAQAAVVRQCAAAGESRDLPRLFYRVLGEIGAVLDRFVFDPRFAQREDLREGPSEDSLDLLKLMSVIGGNDQFHTLFPIRYFSVEFSPSG